jgi:hypothetical protein
MNYFNESNIDFWIENNLNVLLRGRHGTGKTARILQAFKKHNLKYQYFSASTMDPWVDFIGVPKERVDENGVAYLDLVRPKVWQNDEVEAIFLDEFNRSSKKVRNAVMELIQFKSINGKVFKNLRMVWAAINPEEEETVGKYDVEALDPAQMDRFHVVLNVPYQPDASFFREKFGRDQADIALSWWKETLKDNERDLISPRRLDYMLEIFNKGGDIKPLVHTSVTIMPLVQQLKNGPISKQLEDLYEKKDTMGAKKFLFNENNYLNSINHVLKKKELMEFFIPILANEKVTTLMNQQKHVAQFVFANYDTYSDLIKQIAASKSGQLSQQAQQVVMANIKVTDITKSAAAWNGKSNDGVFASKLQSLKSVPLDTTQNRTMTYKTIEEYLPNTMSVSVATDTLRVLDTLVCRSNRDTVISQMPNLSAMIAHTVKVLTENGVKWEGLVDSKTMVNKLNEIDVYVKQNQAISKNP